MGCVALTVTRFTVVETSGATNQRCLIHTKGEDSMSLKFELEAAKKRALDLMHSGYH